LKKSKKFNKEKNEYKLTHRWFSIKGWGSPLTHLRILIVPFVFGPIRHFKKQKRMTQKRINTIEEKIKKLWEKGQSETEISEREREGLCVVK
jgi:hypothetical protein